MKKYLTWHPLGKPGAFIAKKDYDVVREFILSTLIAEEMTLMDLIALGEEKLDGQIGENIAWHILVVKLDLEARGVIFSFLKLAPYKSRFIKVRRSATKVVGTNQNTTGDQPSAGMERGM